MAAISQVKENMIVIGADGARVGIVDKVEGDRIKLTKGSSSAGQHAGHHHFLAKGLIATVEGNTVRLSSNADVAVLFEEEENHKVLNPTIQTQAQRPRTPQVARTVVRTDDETSWSWNKIGVGAVAVGLAAAAGAALLSRRSSGDDFEFRLETDETVRLISSDKVQGTAVIDREGKTLGQIQSFMVDKYSGRVAYAIMSFGGTMGFGASLFPLPWPVLEYDVAKDGYALNVTKEQMTKAPRFEPSKHPEYTADYRQSVISFYRPMGKGSVQ